MLSFSGQVSETISLFADRGMLQGNLDAAAALVSRLGAGEDDPVRKRGDGEQKWKGRLWEGVPAREVIDFLGAYKTHPEAYKVNSVLLAEFIAKMNAVSELTSWTVAVVGGGQGDDHELTPGFRVGMLKRRSTGKAGRYAIGRLLSPRDETLDLDEGEWNEALRLTRAVWREDPARLKSGEEPSDPSGPAIRRVRGEGAADSKGHPERGLLLIYLLDPSKAEEDGEGEALKGLPPVVAIGLSFPSTLSGEKVEYKVNNVAWTQEYGGAD